MLWFLQKGWPQKNKAGVNKLRHGRIDMEHRKMHVTPGEMTRKGAKAGLVVVVLLLLFGMGFGGVVLNEMPASEGGLKMLVAGFFSSG